MVSRELELLPKIDPMRHGHGNARFYTARERNEIVGLAARLQARHEDACVLGDIEDAAQQAGIHPRFVREAAARMGLSSRSRLVTPRTAWWNSAIRWEATAMLTLPTLLLLPRFWHHAPISPGYWGLALLAGWHAFRFGRAGLAAWTATALFLLGGALAVALSHTCAAWNDPLPMYLFARPIPLAPLGALVSLVGWGVSRIRTSETRLRFLQVLRLASWRA